MKTLKEMLGEARQVIPEQPPAELKKRLDAGEPVVVIDVRDPDEYRDGSIEGAANISRGFLEFRVGTVAPEPTTPIVLYWLGGEQIQRYSRHFLLPQVGEKGQRKLLRSKVLLIGAGGLGSPTALYLAAAGVGTLGLMDGDVVDVSNLQRQVLHTTANVGRPKVDSGAEMLEALNPDVNVIKLPTRIDVDNVMDTIKDYDLVVDGSDNFDTRYLVNDACTIAGKTNVHGSIFQFEGMATVFAPGQGPCYRCLYPTPPPAGLVPS